MGNNGELPSGFDWWRRTLAYKTGLGITEEEKIRYENDVKAKIKDSQCRKCYEYRDWMLNFSPTVRFMSEQISKIGGNINSRNIICDECDELKAGGFHPELGILICQNRIYSKWHLEDTLAHEMVHAYDHCKFDVDWGNLRHHACSEIRASSLSGECRMMNQIVRNGIWKVSKGHQDCVRRRATLSVRGNPNCKSDEEAARVVNEVFDSCFSDTRPFDSIYR
jgi:inner membrane protease ATP23